MANHDFGGEKAPPLTPFNIYGGTEAAKKEPTQPLGHGGTAGS